MRKRKQMRSVSVLSTAAFLAMCSSFISFAAGGWRAENGGWSYYDENGERVTETWIKEGDRWYWLDADGSMASEQWVEIGDANGRYWYYLQKDGSALRGLDGSGSTTIDGKRYVFDAEGRMLSGWVSRKGAEDGGEVWSYYDENGEQVIGDWVRQGDRCYWIDEEGSMVSDGLLQIKEDYYYFKEDGSMASEEWIGIPNENAEEEDGPQQYWYYFQKNGKAYRRPDSASSGSIKAKTIDGKKYAFDTEGRMLYGWVSDGERQTGDDAWSYSDHYFGTEDSGVMCQGWANLPVDPDSLETDQPGSDFWEEIDHRWFYFNENGRKVKGEEDGCRFKTIDGGRYGFDEYGRMIVSWYADPDEITLAANKSDADAEGKGEGEYQGQADYSEKFMYYGTPEEGARYIKGWFKAIPSEYLMKSKYDEQTTATYYADKDGNICASEIKTIDGERYGFDNYGRRLSGLVCLKMEDERTSSQIEYHFKSDASVSSGKGPFSNEEEFDELVETYAEDFGDHRMRFYWFGGKDNAMMTGKQRVELTSGGDKYEFMFETQGRYKGCGVYGEKNGRLYKAGMLVKPEEGEKFAIVKQAYETLPEDATQEEKEEFSQKDPDGNGRIEGAITMISVEDFVAEACDPGIFDEEKDETVWTVGQDLSGEKYYLIDKDGDIIKNGKSAKNDEGYTVYVKDKKIQKVKAEG